MNLNNRALRIAITKIRLSSNLFLVERGRWGVNRIERNERLCTLCGCVEDEFHCLLECPRFDNERRDLLPAYLIEERNMLICEVFVVKRHTYPKKTGTFVL